MLLEGQGPVDHQPQEFGAGIELEGVTPHRNVRLPSGVPGAKGEEGDHALLTEEHLLLLAPLFDLLDSQVDVSASFFFVVVAGPDGEDEIFFPHPIVCPGKVQESHDGLSRFLLLEAVADVLDHPQEWSSQLLFFLKPAYEWLKMPLASARWYRRVWTIRSMVFTMQEVRMTGRYDSIEPAGFPAFSKGMMVAFRQACGTSDSWSDWLKIPSNSPLARGPKAFRKLGGCRRGQPLRSSSSS